MGRLIFAIAVVMACGSCAAPDPEPDPIPVIEWADKAPDKYRHRDGTSTVCIKRPIRNLYSGEIERIEEFCQ